MPTKLISKDKIRQLADKAAGLQMPGGNPRLKIVMARLLNDLFVAIDELDISMDEVWAAVAYLTKAAPEYGLVVPGIGLERFLDMRLDEAERLAGLSGGTPRAIEGPLYVAGAPVSKYEARLDDGTDDGEADEDEADEQPGVVRADQPANGERRPRRRGRRGGRRRRGGPEDGLAGSIADELGPTSIPEATSAVADFDGVPPEPSLPVIQPESIAPAVEVQHADRGPQEAAPAYAQEETAQEAERAARRRSTVREKVSFLVDAQPAAATPATQSQPELHSQPEPAAAPAEPASETTSDTQPRRAGWWSRRFGNGE